MIEKKSAVRLAQTQREHYLVPLHGPYLMSSSADQKPLQAV